MADWVSLDRPVRIVGDEDHPHAARQIERGLAGKVVRVAVEGAIEVRLRLDPAMAEGAFSISVPGTGPIEIEGGPFSGVIYGANAFAALIGPDDLSVPVGRIDEAPGLAHRTFWNWDHSTNWNMSQIGAQEIGVFNAYGKPQDGFLADFKRMVDFMSLNRIPAVIIWGFLRDSHGGVAAGQELCRYATERGVRILPGVAINAYGGAVWDMDHQYNLATWLRRHPELAAQMTHRADFQLEDLDFPLYFPNGDYTVRGCSSQEANRQWMADAVTWLSETFQIGGVDIEAGDYGFCTCARCVARRDVREAANRAKAATESWSLADLADYYPVLFEIVKAKYPDAWVYAEAQWDNLLDPAAQIPLAGMPEGGIYQHTLNRSYWNRVEQETTREYAKTLPTKSNVFRAQFLCQWNGDYRTERYRMNARDIAAMAGKAHDIGFSGLGMFGEPGAYQTSAEISYLALARFGWNPELTWDRFMAEDVGPLVGGLEAAKDFVDLAEELDGPVVLTAQRLGDMAFAARDGMQQSSGEVARRWMWLTDRIERRRYDLETQPEGAAW